MILDRLDNAVLYRPLGPRIAAAMDFLACGRFAEMPDGRYAIDGDRLFAIVQRYRTRPPAKARWEAHRQYIDVQFLADGVERIGYAPWSDRLRVAVPYDEAKDVVFFDAHGDLLEIAAGSFALFAPQDVHAPGLVGGSPPIAREVLKVVVKCRVDDP